MIQPMPHCCYCETPCNHTGGPYYCIQHRHYLGGMANVHPRMGNLGAYQEESITSKLNRIEEKLNQVLEKLK